MLASPFTPVYLDRLSAQELHQRAEAAWQHLGGCDLCPRNCRKDRLDQQSEHYWL